MHPRVPLRTVLFAFTLTYGLSLVSCTPGSRTLHGIRLPHPLTVGAIAVRELREGGSDSAFTFRADPGGLLCVFFGYAHCPDICPTTLADLRRTLRMLGPDSARVRVAFVTVDPARDSAAVLAPFLHAFIPGAHALRPASQDELADAERAFGATSSVSRRADGTVDVSHTGASYVVDAGGHVLLEWDYGTKPADMASDLGVLLRLQRSVRR
jgi:protein SCO1/2